MPVMGWVKVETRFISHPKVLSVGPLGECLWLRGLCYAGEYLTDGFIPRTYLERMGDLDGIGIANTLVDAGLWDTSDGGFMVHDYLEWQQSREQVEQISSIRAASGRQGGRQRAINLQANAKQIAKQTPSKTQADTDTDTDTDQENVSIAQFDQFWSSYPRKVAKPKARTAWLAMSKKDQRAALERLPMFLPYYEAKEPDFIPHPTTWLNQKRWEDEIPEPAKPNGNGRNTNRPGDREYWESIANALNGANE